MQIESEEPLSDMNYALCKDEGICIDSRTGFISNFTTKMAQELDTGDRFPPIFLKEMNYHKEFLPPLVEMPQCIDYATIFKDFPVKSRIAISFTKGKERKTLQKIATYVSQIYTTFLELDDDGRDELREKGIHTPYFTDPLPNSDECRIFKTNLKNRIIKELSTHKKIDLITNDFPKEILYEIFKSSIHSAGQRPYLFPLDTITNITLKNDAFILDIHLGWPKKPKQYTS